MTDKTTGNTPEGQAASSNIKDPLSQSLIYLVKAADKLDKAIEHAIDERDNLKKEQREMGKIIEDRSKLAQMLDEEEARYQKLHEATTSVSSRLLTATKTIKSILDAHTNNTKPKSTNLPETGQTKENT